MMTVEDAHASIWRKRRKKTKTKTKTKMKVREVKGCRLCGRSDILCTCKGKNGPPLPPPRNDLPGTKDEEAKEGKEATEGNEGKEGKAGGEKVEEKGEGNGTEEDDCQKPR